MIRERQTGDLDAAMEVRLHRRIGRELRPAGRVLEVGYASTKLVEYLSRAYQQHITGVYICPETLPIRVASSRRRGHLAGHTFATDLNFVTSQSVDAAVIMWALPDVKRPVRILQRVACALRPGGKILIVESLQDSLPLGMWRENYHRPDELTSMLELVGIQEVTVELIERDQIIWVVGFRPEWL
jgi:SAM-dependent methyltransferase